MGMPYLKMILFLFMTLDCPLLFFLKSIVFQGEVAAITTNLQLGRPRTVFCLASPL
jgi:hypothetical protein